MSKHVDLCSHYLVEIRLLGGQLVGGESTSWLAFWLVARWFVGGMTVNLLNICNHVDKPVEGV